VAKRSLIVKNQRRRLVVAHHANRRRQLKETIRSPRSTPAEIAEAQRALQKLPRDASPVRVRNRDNLDGRPRAVYRKFALSRLNLRALAHRGELPGVTKSSW